MVAKVIHEEDCKYGILKDYLGFVHLIKNYQEIYEKTNDGIRSAVFHAINDYVSGKIEALPDFVDYLDKRGEEIRGMYLNECDEAKVKKVIADEARAAGKAEGKTEGKAEGIIKMVLKFNGTKELVIENLVTELNITPQEAEGYYEMYTE